MRPSAAVTCLLVATASPAFAGESKGGGSGGGGTGALGHVSAGIGQATRAGSPQSSSGGGGNYTGPRDYDTDGRRYDSRPYVRRPMYAVVMTGVAAGVATAADTPARQDAVVEGYIGAQKVHDSDGSFTAELAVRDGRFRLAGAVTRFYEGRADERGNLTMTMPQITFGVRIDDGGRTRVWLEGGVIGAKTNNDPVMDSSLTGVIGGMHVEHKLARKASALVEASAMRFSDDVRATNIRVGARLGVLQASFRVLDFNVGPALYGPELGLRF